MGAPGFGLLIDFDTDLVKSFVIFEHGIEYRVDFWLGLQIEDVVVHKRAAVDFMLLLSCEA